MVNITENSIKKIKQLMKENNEENLRVFVSGGGCSGFQYGFVFDNEINDNDTVIKNDGVKIIIDDESLSMIKDSTIDYVKSISGESFSITNPNAKASCGCGKSFTPSDNGEGCANNSSY